VKGSIRKPRTKGGTWAYRLDLGIGADGRRDQKQVGGFRTRKEAEAALAEALAGFHRHSYVAPSKQTLGEFVEDWLGAVKSQIDESAWLNYAGLLRHHVVPRIGHVRLVDVSPQKVAALYGELLQSGKRDGSPLAPRSVLQVHKTLRRALNDAVRWNLLVRNPVAAVSAPRYEKHEPQTWSVDQARTFLQAIAGDRLFALWLLALNTGMRRGELAGLRWIDVDLDAGRVSVTRQRTTASYRVLEKDPKGTSRRAVDIGPEVVAALRAHRKVQLEERLLVGSAWADTGHVFVAPDGRPYHPQRIRVLLEKLCATAGVPTIRLHDLRHTMATVALEAGVHPKVVQERLGHSSISVTLDIYSHVAPSMQRDAADKLDGLFGSTGSGPQ
jgi:integrase